ncbi:CRAL-TRIO domain-containing protein [Fimicolochytrium jonesii]|uniref:CRAL-TRIO domain-containing protein n=1 Tax=Fimicolochytrium jonesii TaxID=1396493 RepID=UPI0022FF2F26|nr:CRAL-TRIO domain-containing protein [Fimicolochytrium jonesii]KAI8818543.1 CRAL-TRIO domain-containing protein [Fimicolochytrium jonesii]
MSPAMSPTTQQSALDVLIPTTAPAFEAFRQRLFTDAQLSSLHPENLTTWWQAKFFQMYAGDGDLAVRAIAKLLVWREGYDWFTLPQEDYADQMASGKLYFEGVDRDGFPVLIFRQERHLAKADPDGIARNVRFLIWFMDRAIRDGTIKSRVTVFLDRINVGSANTESLAFIRHAVPQLQTAFPEIINKVAVFPAGMILYGMWKIAQPLIAPRLVKKIVICSGEFQNALFELVSPENLSRRYGGTLKQDGADVVGTVGERRPGIVAEE